MLDWQEIVDALDGDDSLPVIEYLRMLPADGSASGAVLLVGVVHDHPASTRRVAKLLEVVNPDVLALELPPLAIPLFELYADDTITPPRLGGEMSAAIQMSDAIRVVGIDAPNRQYLQALRRRFSRSGDPLSTRLAVLKDLGVTTAHAVACRIGAVLGRATGRRPRLYSPIQHVLPVDANPSEQAEFEARHLTRQRAFIGAIEVPTARQAIDEAREEAMAARLEDLRTTGDVVAVVGMEHLETLEDRLRRSGA